MRGRLPCRVVVLGAGFGGLTAVHNLVRLVPRERVRITLVAPQMEAVFRPDFVFAPVRPPGFVRRLRMPLARHLGRLGVTWLEDVATRIHAADQRVELMAHPPLPYDVLFWATGMDWAWEAIPGLGPQHGYVCDAAAARRVASIWSRSQPASLLLAAGPLRQDPRQRPNLYAGCECPLYELAFLARDRSLARRRQLQIQVVTGADVAGEELGPAGRDLLHRLLAERGVEVLTGAAIRRVDDAGIEVELAGVRRRVAADAMIWMPPVAGSGLARASSLDDGWGWVPTNAHLQHVHWPNIYAVGDLNRDALPKVGHRAMVQAASAVRHFAARLRGGPPPEPPPPRVVAAVHLGRGQALFDLHDTLYGGDREWALVGRAAAWAKLFFSYAYRAGNGDVPLLP